MRNNFKGLSVHPRELMTNIAVNSSLEKTASIAVGTVGFPIFLCCSKFVLVVVFGFFFFILIFIPRRGTGYLCLSPSHRIFPHHFISSSIPHNLLLYLITPVYRFFLYFSSVFLYYYFTYLFGRLVVIYSFNISNHVYSLIFSTIPVENTLFNILIPTISIQSSRTPHIHLNTLGFAIFVFISYSIPSYTNRSLLLLTEPFYRPSLVSLLAPLHPATSN